MDFGNSIGHPNPMTSDEPSQRRSRISARVVELLVDELDDHLARSEEAARLVARLRGELPLEVVQLLDAVFAAPMSYRDGVFIQLAWGLMEPDFDHTLKGEGGRSAAANFASALFERHIRAVKDAYQNIGKNTRVLARGNVPPFDDLLHWMNDAEEPQRRRLLSLLSATVSLTARPVQPMPTLARAQLSFVAVGTALDALFAIPSQGAHEQFAIAAFLEALVDEFGLGGIGGLSVRTKNINASDASSGAAADVQVMRGNKIEEAFEVSASSWRGKLDQALLAARNADLPRIHILAYGDDLAGLAEALGQATTDVTVIDVRSFLRSLIATIKKPAREVALRLLYDHLERKQPDINRVNAYVELLSRHSLAA
jgi:hypothetical protein